jgi:hypothetical protein
MPGSRLVQYQHAGDVLNAERLHPRSREDDRHAVVLSSIKFLALPFVLTLDSYPRLLRKLPQMQGLQMLIERPPTGMLSGFVRLNDRSTGTAR